ncbi:methyltransferase domain-containing protein [Xenophilus arseniciresistens]|uniref:Methyltransferase domain-containing protein n=1 Tax=Xenophilus arseniciresistens TaxID=1283306 RepID=A0AAE3N570_9BURK|nr:methyltransferase domain-containing protein [Xenophilus arseniciresistens]MDA7416085.1 methyltransferase domain-containing protein [Xenophilus arseniciresistens]
MSLFLRIPRTATLALLAAGAACAHAQLSEEVPFITTPDHVTLEMLRIAEVGAADHVIDLGSGDGRIVITAARQFGASGLGVELVPDLVEKSRANARRAGVAGKVEFRTQDIFDTDLSSASVITMYLLPEVNLQLRPRLLRMAPGTRIVSHDWDMGDWKPDRSVKVDVPDKKVGLEKSSRIHMWRVPAPVEGLWCAGAGALRFAQRHQQYSAQLQLPGASAQRWKGRIVGAELPAPVGGPLRPALHWREGALEVKAGVAGLAAGTRFERAGDKAACGA